MPPLAIDLVGHHEREQHDKSTGNYQYIHSNTGKYQTINQTYSWMIAPAGQPDYTYGEEIDVADLAENWREDPLAVTTPVNESSQFPGHLNVNPQQWAPPLSFSDMTYLLLSLQGDITKVKFAVNDAVDAAWDMLMARLERGLRASDFILPGGLIFPDYGGRARLWFDAHVEGTYNDLMGEKNPWPTWADPGLVSSAGSNDDVHLVLDGLGTFIGMVFPPLGAVFDLANAYLYYQEGQYGQATLSVLSAVPWAGDALGVAKYGKDYKAAISCGKAAEGAGLFFKNVRNLERGANFIQGAAGVGQGGYDAYQNGLSGGNVLQMGLGLLGMGAAARSTQLPCFLAGTLVSTPEGLRRIEEILSGDRVWGYDLRRGEWRGCVVSYHASVAYDDLVVTVRAGGSEVKSTYHHPYWVVSGEDLDQRPTPDQLGEQLQSVPGVEGRWVDAGDLRVGDVLLSRTGGQSTVESVEAEHTPTTVYHLYVEDVHNYAVGDQEWLVHNAHTGRVDDVVQDHHAIPWSNKTYKHQKHPLVKLAGNPKLKTMPENLKPVQGHAGRHSTSYHDEINDRMDVAYEKVMKVKDAAKRGPAAKRQLNKVIQDIWADIGDETLPLYDHKDVILP